MAFMIAIPAVLGIVINEFTRGWGHEKLSPALSPACKFMMMGVIASNSTAMSEYVLHMNVERLEVALFILVFAISGFVVGFLVARALHLPYSETTTMCFTCGMRNISSGGRHRHTVFSRRSRVSRHVRHAVSAGAGLDYRASL